MSTSGSPAKPPSEYTPRAWSVIFGASMAAFCSVGFVNSYGVFQEYYLANQLADEAESTVAWLGGLAIFFIYVGGAVSGPLLDFFGPEVMLCVGSVGTVFSIMMSSICHEFYQFLLAQGISMGIFMSLLLAPSIAVVGKYIKVKRGAAMGIVIAGSSLGGVIWPIAINELLKNESVGFGWTMRIVGFIMIPLLAAGCFFCRSPPKPLVIESESLGPQQEEKPSQRRPDFSILKKPEMQWLAVAYFFICFGLFSPFFFITSYAVANGFSHDMAFYTVSIVNGASMFGRVLPGMVADKYGRFNLCVTFTLLSGIVALCWTKATSVAGLVVFSAAYGFTSGAILSLQQVCAAQVATPQTIGLAVGTIFGAGSLPAMASTPISGELAGKYGYLALSTFAGVSLIVGSVFLLFARVAQDRKVLAVV
ncbi:MCT family MFS transporter [Aspergillus stella-maris]|uniref:MCT family MFS transporter n=1 Tax=Aspergillus stella-maris TaxID=1810926 RepID=UPI003CCD643E